MYHIGYIRQGPTREVRSARPARPCGAWILQKRMRWPQWLHGSDVAVTGVVLPAKKSTLYCKLRNKWSFIKRSHNHMFQGNQTDSTLEFCCEIVASCLGYQILALCRWSTTFNLLASFKATQSITGLGVVSEIYFWNTRVKLFILKRKLLLTL